MFDFIINSYEFKSLCEFEDITIIQSDCSVYLYCKNLDLESMIMTIDELASFIDELYEIDGQHLGNNPFVEMIFNSL